MMFCSVVALKVSAAASVFQHLTMAMELTSGCIYENSVQKTRKGADVDASPGEIYENPLVFQKEEKADMTTNPGEKPEERVSTATITTVMKKQETTISDLADENKHLILEIRNLTNQTEQLLVENKVLQNQTEQLLVENKVLQNQTEQPLVEKRSLSEQNKQLMEKTRILENQTAEMRKERDNLNWTLEVILTFENFPVKDFCPQRKCKPCLDGWIMLKKSCYLFNYESSPWKTWEQSRQYCRTKGADLVVIDSLEEQKFVSNRSSYYYDTCHGYWLGLREVNSNWTWVDGRIDTLKYWINGIYGTPGPYALLIPQKNYSENWDRVENTFLNRFICERDVLIKSD
ncbi:C-type lectin domain family 10 member A-like isoform X2 [Girardinichthys multiradiatus]|uniref:C-type lectin domain family 10 member A-like isoform X2 n=1 Tax=Girardinichthys multiradiatus TaxID=208333 RepID=UPI001FAD0893|nr:C-type lectin domain family 10 member A-like isoform X2 [Girardinichthys multiradiatus]